MAKLNEILAAHYDPKAPTPFLTPDERLDVYEWRVGDAIDDIAHVIEWLREEKHFAQADRLRTIAGQMARLREESAKEAQKKSIRWVARGWK